MKHTIFLTFLGLLAFSQQEERCKIGTVVPAVGYIGQTISLYDPITSVGNQIIELGYSANKTTPTCSYLVPDSVIYTDYQACSFSPITRVANNVKDFQSRYTEMFSVHGGLGMMTNSWSEEVRWAYDQMEMYNKSIQYSQVTCLLYNLQLTTDLRLQKWFVDVVTELPTNLTGDTIHEFFRFFNTYGDHVVTKCSVGGLAYQYISTDYDYWVTKTQDYVNDLSWKQFMIELDSTKAKRWEMDKNFVKSSDFRPVVALGGVYPQNMDSWTYWTTSILEEKKNLVCAQWEAWPVTQLFNLDHRLTVKKDVVQIALDIYLSKPSCNHIMFSNKAPVGAIMKINDYFKCTSKIEGSYWLVKGEDPTDGTCVVSWAFTRGEDSTVVGVTQQVRTDFNKVSTCLKARIVRDGMNCVEKTGGSDVTFLLKDPSNNIYTRFIESATVPIDQPVTFDICPTSKQSKLSPLLSVSDQNSDDWSQVFSLKNNCKTPYCTKIKTEWTEVTHNVTVLSYVTIEKKYFDPIQDPDIIDFSQGKINQNHKFL